MKKYERPSVSTLEVYHWPEFRAFAERLGIEWEQKTLDIIIEMRFDEHVKVTHTFRGSDAGTKPANHSEEEKEEKEVDIPTVCGTIETSTQHNKHWRTYRPLEQKAEDHAAD